MTFIEDSGVLYFLKVNPTSIEINKKERTTVLALDGFHKLSYQDTTELTGKLVWDNVPLHKTQFYNSVSALQDKTGCLLFNKIPQLVGRKNLIQYSEFNSGWSVDGSLYSPVYSLGYDNILNCPVYCSHSSATGMSNIHISDTSNVFREHNVFSCYVKYFLSSKVGIFVRSVTTSTEYRAVFEFSGSGTSLLFSLADSNITKYVVENMGYGWFRIAMYINGINASEVDNNFYAGVYPDYSWVLTEQKGTYVCSAQLEQDVEEPTWYLATEGIPISEPFNVIFYSLIEEHLNLFGYTKYKLQLPFKLTGGWL
jgi:hypothetical protein